MKVFSLYGNCQTGALAHTLKKSEIFTEKYMLNNIKPIQNIKRDGVKDIEKIFNSIDLLIYQIISDDYHINDLSTSKLKQLLKINSTNISFPSLYFNAYFPHLDMFRGQESILGSVHDYIVMYCFIKGMNEQETIDLINSDNIYDNQTSQNVLLNSLNSLRSREINNDIKITDYIESNYKNIKLFNQFNHPRGIVFDHIANQVLNVLGFSKIEESLQSKTFLDGIMTPVYESTYKNLDLNFKEDFSTYLTFKGPLQTDEVINEWFGFYKTIDNDLIENEIKNRKPFVINMFKRNNI